MPINVLPFEGRTFYVAADGDDDGPGTPERTSRPPAPAARVFYCVIFGEHPAGLDYTPFNDIANYESGKFGFYVHQPDLGELIEITPERAPILHDTIREVVRKHPSL